MSVFDRPNALVTTAPNEGPSGNETPDWGALPEKINPQMPDEAWALTQETAKLATMHLHALMQPHIFKHMSRRDQARFIGLAMNRAYGSVDGAIRKHMHINIKPEDREGFNEMANLSRRAAYDLPEMKGRRRGGDDEPETVVPLRRHKVSPR